MPIGTNSVVMRESNKKLVLNLIRTGNYSRADIAKKIGLTKAALTILTDELLQDGVIYEEYLHEYTGVGRKPSYLRLQANSRYVVGLALTRAEYKIGLFDLLGTPIHTQKYNYVAGSAEKNLAVMADQIEKYKKMVDVQKILGVGVACPGPLDYRTGTILNPPNFERWQNCKFSEILSSLCNLPVNLENISNAMAIAERYFGLCKDEKDFAYIFVDNGIGSGIMVNERIYRSNKGHGNELGHISIDYNGQECPCGNRGCLEVYATISALIKGTKYKSWKEVVDNNDTRLIDKEIEYLSCGIVSLLNLFDLGAVVLGGELSEGEDVISKKLSEAVNKKVIVRHPVRIMLSGNEIEESLAAASVALNKYFFTRE